MTEKILLRTAVLRTVISSEVMLQHVKLLRQMGLKDIAENMKKEQIKTKKLVKKMYPDDYQALRENEIWQI